MKHLFTENQMPKFQSVFDESRKSFFFSSKLWRKTGSITFQTLYHPVILG